MKKIIKKIIPKKIIKFMKSTKICFFKSVMYIMRVFPINNNKIVACNFNGKGYGDNCKNVVSKLIEKKYKVIWLIKEYDDLMPKDIKQIKYGSLNALFHLSTAKFWLDNNRKEEYIIKRAGQIYIQMWHGCIALKKIEKHAEKVLDSRYIKRAMNDSKMIDLMISNSNFSDRLFTECFWYEGKILKCGTPRIDTLFNDNKTEAKNNFCKKYNIDEDSMLVIYAPTFRDDADLSVYDFDREKIINCFENKFDKKVYLLLRLHPNLKGVVKFKEEGSDKVIDVSNYADIYDLMTISDFLITDYSSLMFEFPVSVRKGVFIFAKDISEYNRGFYFDIYDLPFSISTNSNELCENIINFNENIYNRKIDKFFNDIDLFEDGFASDRLVDYISNIR